MRNTRLLRVNPSSGAEEIVLEELFITESALERMKGLLGKTGLSMEQGLLITPCNSVHSLFMGFTIDVVYLDRDNRVCQIRENMQPWRCSASFKAKSVLELAAGQVKAKNIQIGDQLQW